MTIFAVLGYYQVIVYVVLCIEYYIPAPSLGMIISSTCIKHKFHVQNNHRTYNSYIIVS